MAVFQAPREAVDDRDASIPPLTAIRGSYTSLIPVSLSHSADLGRHLGGSQNAHLIFLPCDPPLDQATFYELVSQWFFSTDPVYFAVTDLHGEALGIMSLLCIEPKHKGIELGWVVLGDALKRTR